KCFFNLAFLFNFIIDYILVLYFSVAFFISFIFSCLGLGVIVLFFYSLRRRKEKVISLIKGVKKLRLLTASTLTKIEKAPTPLNS
ncbi:hypothetical protein JT156_04810, partial [Helicobacter pylori]|nr:hypothetical protein [Helicobacter pylori]